MDFFLARLPAFKRLPESTLADLSRRLISRKYGKNEPIFEEGGRADAVYILRSGLLKAVKYSPTLEPACMKIIAPGELFGMIAVMDNKPYPISAIPLQASEAYRIPAELFASLIEKHPSFSKEIYASIGGHLRQSQTLRSLAGEPVDRRIAHILGTLAESIGKDIPVRREEIADLAACTPATAIRTLAAFRKKGWIASGWKRISVLKPDALRRLAENA